MIVYKQWLKKMNPRFSMSDCWSYEGWFLFGLLPLYIRRLGLKK